MGARRLSPHLLVEKRDGIAYVTLNRPDKRAFSPEMLVRLCDAWWDIAADPSIRVAVDWAGTAFSSGGDLGSVIPLMMRTRKLSAVEERLPPTASNSAPRSCAMPASSPVVVAINGHAHAGGAEFLLAPTSASCRAKPIALTEVRRGLIAGGGSLTWLARQVPWAHAMELHS
jgi:enoyl-CoA hydratase